MTRPTTIYGTGDAGAARGALDAAVELNLKIGGHTAADQPAPYADRLRRTLAPHMAARLNVQDSDGTLILSFREDLREGSPAAYADEAVGQQRKASLHIVLPAGGRSAIPEDVRKGVLAWIAEEKIATLHVTGPRESEEPGIQQAVHDALVWIFEDEVPLSCPVALGPDTFAAGLTGDDAEIARIVAAVAAMPSPTHIAINPANVDAAIAAGLDVQWVAPPGAPFTVDECHAPPTVRPFATTAIDAESLVSQDIAWSPPLVPPEVWAARDRLLGELSWIPPAVELMARAEATLAGRAGLVQQLAAEGHITQEQALSLLEAPRVEPPAPDSPPAACPTCSDRMAQHAGTPIRPVIHGGLMHVALLDDASETALCAPATAIGCAVVGDGGPIDPDEASKLFREDG